MTPLPVQVYRYTFETAPEMDSNLDDAQIAELFEQVNEIWATWGLQWEVIGAENRTVAASEFPGASEDRTALREQLRAVAPPGAADKTWRVVLIGEFPVPAGGLYLADVRTVFYAQRARGGPTSPIILAHELGHSLGLQHERDSSNLMHSAAGGRGVPEENATDLTSGQVEKARAQVVHGPAGVAQQIAPPTAGNSRRSGGPSNDPARRSKVAARLRSFDLDQDGIILIDDVPPPGQRVFRQLDTDGDGRLDEGELEDFER